MTTSCMWDMFFVMMKEDPAFKKVTYANTHAIPLYIYYMFIEFSTDTVVFVIIFRTEFLKHLWDTLFVIMKDYSALKKVIYLLLPTHMLCTLLHFLLHVFMFR